MKCSERESLHQTDFLSGKIIHLSHLVISLLAGGEVTFGGL